MISLWDEQLLLNLYLNGMKLRCVFSFYLFGTVQRVPCVYDGNCNYEQWGQTNKSWFGDSFWPLMPFAMILLSPGWRWPAQRLFYDAAILPSDIGTLPQWPRHSFSCNAATLAYGDDGPRRTMCYGPKVERFVFVHPMDDHVGELVHRVAICEDSLWRWRSFAALGYSLDILLFI